jgi:hypothetical protein
MRKPAKWFIDNGRDESDQPARAARRATVLTSTVDKVKVQFVLGKTVGDAAAAVCRLSARRYPGRCCDCSDASISACRRRSPNRSNSSPRSGAPMAAPCRSTASLLDISGGGVGLMATPSLAALLPRGRYLTDVQGSACPTRVCWWPVCWSATRGRSPPAAVPATVAGRLRVPRPSRRAHEHAAALHQPHRTRAQGPTERHGLKKNAAPDRARASSRPSRRGRRPG